MKIPITRAAIGLSLAILVGAGGIGLYRFGVKQGMSTVLPATSASETNASNIDPATGRKVLYWHDPMVPGQKFDKPGKSPYMDMMLVPVYADADGDENRVSVSARVQQNLGMRTAEVRSKTMTSRVEATGSIAYNERDQTLVQARASAFVERLYVRATLDRVNKGQALVDLYVPDWVAAQEEFLSVRRMHGNDLDTLIDAARQRMRQAGMNEAQIALVEASGTLHPRITLSAPIGGVVVELLAREGMTVMPGATLFRINALGTVWVNVEVPESQAALLRQGAAVEARSAALPGMLFKGTLQAILPEVNATTRTIRARLELANPGSQLSPGMFVSVHLIASSESVLVVPSEAIIQTGRRTLVMLAENGGKFRPAEVEIGMESEGQTEIKHGLEAGQKVVLSGQFLLDSEANLRASTTRMQDEEIRETKP